jgi:hypothetical protein
MGTKAQKQPAFVPKPTARETKGVFVELEIELHGRIKAAAGRSGVSMRSLIVQAIVFAMDNMEHND